ncbi:hypothetical protein ACIQ6V_27850 [Streptomyces sp. NPDC096198]|uniref:hypothetical protein n=1 Tax=Streptomyces sp. NPDC096198 TaxID=3366080 RepID=UPI00382C1B60
MTDSGASLLTNSLERFQAVKIGDTQVVVSVEDTLPLGEGSDFGKDHTSEDVRLFAESVVLQGALACKSAVVSVNSLTTKGDSAELSTSGAAGKPLTTQNHDVQSNGKRGDDGKPAGPLSIYIENALADAPGFTLSAKGGAGGAGEEGVRAPGGNGGDGGKGGSVTLIAGTPLERYLNELAQVSELKTLREKQQAVGKLRARIKNDGDIPQSRKSTIDKALQQIEETSESQMGSKIATALRTLGNMDTTYSANALAAIHVGGGAYGAYGTGTPSGKNGAKGSDGTRDVILIGLSDDLEDPHLNFSPFILTHPSQCARLLEVIRLRYVTLDPVQDKQGVSDLANLLTRLEARTRLFSKLDENSSLARHYAAQERSVGAVGAVAQLRAVNTQCKALLSQLKSGLDVYGYDPQWTPLGSFDFYNSLLGQLITNFSAIEKSNQSYFDDLKQNKASMESIKAARQQSETAQKRAENEVKLITRSLDVIDHNIAVCETDLPALKSDLVNKLKQFAEDVRTQHSIDVDQLLSALSMVAFAPQSKFMMLTQLADVVYHNASSLATDAGVNVNRAYLVSEIKAIGPRIEDLKEGYKSLDNGVLQADDPQAGKLVVEESKFRATFDALKNTFSRVKEVEDAFTAYIEKILDRNTQILLYNANVLLAARDFEEIKSAQKRISELNDNALNTVMKPDLPDLVSFVSQLYYRSREQIMRTLDLTARAYRMWALSDRDLIAETFAGTQVSTIGEAALRVASNTVLSAYRDAVQNFGTNSSRFPALPGSQGITVKATGLQVNLFKKSRIITFRPMTVDARTEHSASPFAGMANVRVGKVRVWMKGAKTKDNRLQIRIRHAGDEEIVSAGNQVYRFIHEPIDKNFTYYLDSEKIFEEADFEPEQGSDKYAAVGPFTSWHIEVRPSDNDGLDMSGVTEVSLEFHGTNYSFRS